MPLLREDFISLLNNFTGEDGYNALLTTERAGISDIGDRTIIEHTINGHIYDGKDITMARGTHAKQSNQWTLWNRIVGTPVHTRQFEMSFARFNRDILRYSTREGNLNLNNVRFPIQESHGEAGHYKVEIPFSDDDYNAVVNHDWRLYDLRGPDSRQLQHIVINIDANKITSIMPSFQGNLDNWLKRSSLPHPPLEFMEAH